MGIFDFLKSKDQRVDELTGKRMPVQTERQRLAAQRPAPVRINRMASPGITRVSSTPAPDDGFMTSAMLANAYSEPSGMHHSSSRHSSNDCAPSSYDSGGSYSSSSCDSGSSSSSDSGGGSCGGCD